MAMFAMFALPCLLNMDCLMQSMRGTALSANVNSVTSSRVP